MHVPDAFLDAPTSATTAVVAAAGVALALRRSRGDLDDRVAPLAGLVATFVFAAQMLQFPVAGGTSGHLLGGALAAVLIGPWTATLAITVVLLVQALVFADGGLTALGTNVTLMALVGVWVGYGVFVLARLLLPRRMTSVPVAAAVGAFISVVASAGVFAALFLVGGAAPIAAGTLFGAMLSWHALIAVGEAIITFLVVSAVVSVRPDLVHGSRDLRDVSPPAATQEATL